MSQCKAELRKLNDSAEISFGIVTDVHYADKDMRINRSYREALAKLHECVETFNRSRLAFAVMLGDFIDKAPDRASELEYLRAIRQAFARYAGDKHFVIGNHDLARLSKPEYPANCGTVSQHSYSSFNAGGYHFVILDAGFTKSGAASDAREILAAKFLQKIIFPFRVAKSSKYGAGIEKLYL